MKEIQLITLKLCPYCKKAKRHLKQLQKEEKYKDIKVQIIDEKKESHLVKDYNGFYYVPALYVDKVKYHEGVLSIEILKKLFDEVIDEAF